ncbi:MAG: M28 family peptidase [Acidobacteria bacterium]|nr:M28 family peptidase [Acidobacteriota bacterium]
MIRPLFSSVLSLSLLAQIQQTAPPAASAPPNRLFVRGYPESEQASQMEREKKARDMVQAERIRTYMERMSGEPHHAGSPGSKAVAEYAQALFREWGLDARIETFEALLPYPTTRQLDLTGPTAYRAKLQEPVIAEDKDSGDNSQLPTFNAYSASGDVSGQVVYANYGNQEDYDTLKKAGVDVRGKIVLVRYGNGFRGVKPKIAAQNGAIACLIYSEPKDDGYYRGDVYPKGPFRPSQGVQRGSIMDMAIYPGDPLSPGWASERGSKRLSREQAKTIARIPTIPISYGDAVPLMRAMGGPVAPEPWRGAMALTYHLGPGPATARLKVDFDWTSKPVHDVIAVIPGTQFKDQWVILGNHHDAWVHGANDPLSGASSLLETGRVLARMVKSGWKPKRTIVLCLWDGEEFGMVGSTEWVEKHKAELEQKAVAYINTDSNSRGTLGVGGSPVFEQFVGNVLRHVNDPGTGKPLYETPQRRPNANGLRLGPLGSGSDYVSFLDYAGVPSLNLGFGGDGGGLYHSAYDTFTAYQKFGDPDFSYCRTLSQLTTTMTLRLADAPVLPHEFGDQTKAVRSYVEEIQKDFPNADLKEVNRQLTRLSTASRAFDDEIRAVRRRSQAISPEKLTRLNQALMKTERALLLSQGLPRREWYKHQLYAPGLYTGYGVKTLPGVREALEAGRNDEATQQAANVAKALRHCAAQIEEAATLLRGI